MKRSLVLAVTILMSLLLTCVVFAADPPKAEPNSQLEEEKTEGQQAEEQKAGEKIDINSATLEELMELPGVGEVIAQRIIDARPYAAPEELVEKVKGIGEKTFEKMKDQIVANPVEDTESSDAETPAAATEG